MKKVARGFFSAKWLYLSRLLFFFFFAFPLSSRLGAAALLVQFDLVLEAVVQFEVVVLQGGGGAR